MDPETTKTLAPVLGALVGGLVAGSTGVLVAWLSLKGQRDVACANFMRARRERQLQPLLDQVNRRMNDYRRRSTEVLSVADEEIPTLFGDALQHGRTLFPDSSLSHMAVVYGRIPGGPRFIAALTAFLAADHQFVVALSSTLARYRRGDELTDKFNERPPLDGVIDELNAAADEVVSRA